MDIEGWNKYVACFKDNYTSCDFKDALLEKCGGNEDIACAIFYHTQSNALKWMDSAIPALENKIPTQEINIGNSDAVRQVIWRFPY